MNTTNAAKFLTLLLLFSPIELLAPQAKADTFGTGGNVFSIEFVPVGDVGNADDVTGQPNPAGGVGYEYRIGRYEVSADMLTKADTLGSLGLSFNNAGNKPGDLDWLNAAKFVNWLNESTGYQPAYKFDTGGNFQLWQPSDAGYNAANQYRNSMAHYVLPSTDEWYKAAYYDPTNDVYYNYPTGSDSVPDGFDSPTDPVFDLVIRDGSTSAASVHDIDDVGLSSPYGTEGQGGNLFEWLETQGNQLNNDAAGLRDIRGGDRSTTEGTTRSTSRIPVPANTTGGIGFRVATVEAVPEPSAMLLVVLSALAAGGSYYRRNRQATSKL